MEIELNLKRTSNPAPVGPAAKARAVQTQPSAQDLSGAASLDAKLNDLSLVRPEKVAEAKVKLADEKYPPDDLLDRIAVLLAMQIK